MLPTPTKSIVLICQQITLLLTLPISKLVTVPKFICASAKFPDILALSVCLLPINFVFQLGISPFLHELSSFKSDITQNIAINLDRIL